MDNVTLFELFDAITLTTADVLIVGQEFWGISELHCLFCFWYFFDKIFKKLNKWGRRDIIPYSLFLYILQYRLLDDTAGQQKLC